MNRITMLAIVPLVLCTSALHAQLSAGACSNATLNGAYGVALSGTRPNPTNPSSMEQVIGTVIQIFDGFGNFTQTDNVKGSQSGITFDRPGLGTYSINVDCTGTYTINVAGSPFPIVNRFVIVDGGREFRAVVVSPQAVMVTANGRKVN